MKNDFLLELLDNYQAQYSLGSVVNQTREFILAEPNFWKSSNESGHVTASCWVVSYDYSEALMTNHLKLDRWLQLGGHVEENDKDIFSAAKRELQEESGLKNFELVSDSIFDIDVHSIPDGSNFPSHFHYDIRILFKANRNEKILFDISESKSVQWFKLEEIELLNNDPSIIRLVHKTKPLKQN